VPHLDRRGLDTGSVSMRTARALAGVRDREARKLAARGAVSVTDLPYHEVLALRCQDQASRMDSPETMLSLRDRDIASQAVHVWSAPDNANLYLVVDQSSARLLDLSQDLELFANLLNAPYPRVQMLLPIGLWSIELRRALSEHT
jgi:hypothetical protein